MENPRSISDMEVPEPDLLFNRELSLLRFHRRVFELAQDPTTPLLERLRFNCIVSSNLDEFFEIRVAGIRQQMAHGNQSAAADQIPPREVLRRISKAAHSLVDDQYALLNDALLPELETKGIRFLRRSQWNKKQAAWVQDYFSTQLLPILSPIRLDPAHPFPRVLNKALHFIVQIHGVDEFGQAGGLAVVQAPRVFPRILPLPEEDADPDGHHNFVFLSSIIHAHVGDLFAGMSVQGCYQFRVTRNSDLLFDEEEVDDLKTALEGELSARRYGEIVRLEVADNCPDEIAELLLRRFGVSEQELYRVNGPVNLHRLMAIPDLIDRPELKYTPFSTALAPRIVKGGSLFQVVRQGDVLLHHPYQSFRTVVDFIRQAAADPNVLAIKQTLYRSGTESVIEEALLAAAHAGKVVTVVVELRARFDEEANISIADRLQEAGANVVYGVVGYKTHAKMLLVVRREGNSLRRYVHLGTGNYHAKTAKLYTDYGLLSCDPVLGEDVHKLFMQLTCPGAETNLQKIFQSPFTLREELLDRIAAEAKNAQAGKPSRIIAKMNALVEPTVISALYRASQAGVPIDLVIRGICCLRPGIPGLSETISVRSIVGRFLEHSRIFYFENNGDPDVFLASADWMGRNLFRRVETCFPVENYDLKQQVIEHGLLSQLKDNTHAWVLDSDGDYARLSPKKGEDEYSAQAELIRILSEPLATD